MSTTASVRPVRSTVYEAENLEVLSALPDGFFRMAYLDPPFNTGKTQTRTMTGTRSNPAGTQIGCGGGTPASLSGLAMSFADSYDDYEAFLEPRLREVHRVLDDEGTAYVHLDWHEVHYVKVMLDGIFGRANFLNEIIWAYDYGARARSRWPAKHDTILVYVKDIRRYHFDSAGVDREPYMAPGLAGPEKAALGKLPTDVWWHTIVSPTGREKTGYPTQKPEGVLRRMVTASTRPGDWVLDCFAGSGTGAAVASALERRFVAIDQNPDAVTVMQARLPDGTRIVRPRR